MTEFLQAYDAAGDGDRDALIAAAVAGDWAGLFAELLEHRPLLVGPHRFAVVTTHADCVEVLTRATFSVALYHAKMAAAQTPIMLGEDDTASYELAHGAMRTVVRRDDLARIASLAREAVARHLAGRPDEVDVAALSRDVVVDCLIAYFGLGSTNRGQVAGWAREIFRGVFLELFSPASPRFLAATYDFRASIENEIVAKRASTGADTVLDRLLTLRGGADPVIDDAGIMTNLAGMTAGGVEPITDAVASVVDALLAFPAALAEATAAATSGEPAALMPWITEGLRLRPPLSLLVRTTAQATALAQGTPRAAVIPAGHVVFVAISAAAADPVVAPSPAEFRLDRAWDRDLTFGAGLHVCFGRRMSQAIITEIIAALLRLPLKSRVSGPVLNSESAAFVDRFVVATG